MSVPEPELTVLPMPKWGLTAAAATVIAWLVPPGTALVEGDEVVEIETDKSIGAVEALTSGVLLRQVADEGDVVPVGGILGVVGDPSASDTEIEAFIARFSHPPDDDAGAESGDGAAPAERRSAVGLRYVVDGAGAEQVVLLHGFGASLDSWSLNAGVLAADHTVIGVDLPGHGGSTKDVGGGTLEELAGAVDALLTEATTGPAHLVGHSLGAAVAVAVAAARPDAVASLTLIAPAGFGPELNGEFTEGLIAARTRRTLSPILRLAFADEAHVTSRLVDQVLRDKRIDGAPEALRRIADACFPQGRQALDVVATLADLAVPVAIIWGEQDAITSAADAASAPPRARVEILSAGHSPQIEAAAAVNSIVRDTVAAGRVQP